MKKSKSERSSAAELLEALDELQMDKGITKEYMLESLKMALEAAYKKNYETGEEVNIDIDQVTGKISVYALKQVVDVVENPDLEISLEEAKLISKRAKKGTELKIEVTPKNFNRIAASAGKQIIIQRLREAERDLVYTQYSDKQGEIVVGVRIVIEHLPADAAGKFRTVEAILMAFQCFVIFSSTFFQIQPSTDQCGMISIAQCIMGRPGGLNAENLHSSLQRFLRIGAIRLGIEDHLGIVPFFSPVLRQLKQTQIFPQDTDIIKTPCQENNVLAAPGPKLFHSLRERNALFLQPGFLDTGKLTDPAIQMAVVFGFDQHLELIGNFLGLRHPNGADLNDLTPDLNREHLAGGRRTGPRLVPFHI